MSTPPLRGRRGRDRRIAERIATDFAARHAASAAEAVDFDVAEVDAEVEDAVRAAQTPAAAPSPPSATPAPARPRSGGGHRLPDLAALPPLLARTGTFAALAERLGAPSRPVDGTTAGARRVGRHVGLVSIPHGAKSYLAATLAAGRDGRAPRLDRARRGDRRPGCRGARCLAGRSRSRGHPRASDRARLRTERAGGR